MMDRVKIGLLNPEGEKVELGMVRDTKFYGMGGISCTEDFQALSIRASCKMRWI
jgi:hypothetical protein